MDRASRYYLVIKGAKDGVQSGRCKWQSHLAETTS